MEKGFEKLYSEPEQVNAAMIRDLRTNHRPEVDYDLIMSLYLLCVCCYTWPWCVNFIHDIYHQAGSVQFNTSQGRFSEGVLSAILTTPTSLQMTHILLARADSLISILLEDSEVSLLL